MADQKTNIVISAVDNTRAAVTSASASLKGLEGVGTTLNTTLARLAPLLGAATFTALIKGAIDGADAMHDLSLQTGISVKEIGAWKLVTEQSGTSIEALATALDKGSKYIVEHGDKLKKLGITATTSRELVFQLAGMLEKLAIDDPRRNTLLSVLGRGAKELIPLLSEGEEGLRKMVARGEELNPITAEIAANADKLKDLMAEMNLASSRLGVTLATQLMPELAQTTEAMTKMIEAGHPLLALWRGYAGLGKIVLDFGFPDQKFTITEHLKDLRAELANLEKGSKEVARGGLLQRWLAGGTKEELDAKITQTRNLIAATEKFRDSLDKPEPPKPKTTDKATADKIDKVFGAGDGAAKGPKPEVAKQAAEEYAKLYGEFTKIIDGTATLSKSEQTLRDIQNGRFAELLPWQQEQLANLAREVTLKESLAEFDKVSAEGDARQQEAEQAEADARDAADNQRLTAADEMSRRLVDENEDLNAALIRNDRKRAEEQLRIENERAVQRIYDLGLETEQVQDLLDEQAEHYRLQQRALEQSSNTSIDLVKELGLTFTSSFEEAISAGEDLSDVLEALEKDLTKLLVRKSVTEPIMSGVDSLLKDSGIGDWFSGLFNADGNAFDRDGLMPFALGGVVNAPTPFMFGSGGRLGVMGEAGPEAILPLSRGADGKLGVQGGGGNVTVNVIESPGKGGQVQQQSDGSGNEIITVMVESIKKEVARDIMRGGIVAQSMQNTYALNRAPGAA